jgi:GH43 family beta-xylosidase
MKMRKLFCLIAIISSIILTAQQKWNSSQLRVRDPFILADSTTKTYYLYNASSLRKVSASIKGVDVYKSKDLATWEGPYSVFSLPENFWGSNMIWAPEVHKYNNKYYMFVTFTSNDTLPQGTPENPFRNASWFKPYKRGTQILYSDSPMGSFKIFANKPHTPSDWMCLDGTFFVEDGQPWLIFCHEWVQINDGTINAVKLSNDLLSTIGDPAVLFKASDASWVVKHKEGNVTDGNFLYKTSKGKLLMIWSSSGEKGYAEGIAISETGKISGPWKHVEKLLFAEDGGHGMIFKSFDNRLMFVYHQPNKSPDERVRLVELIEDGESISIK